MLRWNHDSTIEKWTAATDVVKSEVFINKYISASKEISLFDNSEEKKTVNLKECTAATALLIKK